MRISLLLEREPFGSILERTLETYWSTRNSAESRVKWFPRNAGVKMIRRQGFQPWLGNLYLNVFARAGTDGACFEVLRREYARSVCAWKRPIQRLYVEAATNRLLMPILAQVAFGVTPDAPERPGTLVLGGNHRLRLLHPRQDTSTVILKHGFPRGFIENEIALRSTLNIPCCPRLRSFSLAQGWLEEDQVFGTPINRLPQHEEMASVERAQRDLREYVIRPTLRMEPATFWMERLIEGARRMLNNPGNCLTQFRADIAQLLDGCYVFGSRLLRSTDLIPTAMTHGDFQPGNILATRIGVRLIDWEGTDRRASYYDPLVYVLRSRSGLGLSLRLKQFLAEETHFAHGWLSAWPGVDWCFSRRRHLLLFYVLEELVFNLREVAVYEIREPGRSLAMRLKELRQILNELG